MDILELSKGTISKILNIEVRFPQSSRCIIIDTNPFQYRDMNFKICIATNAHLDQLIGLLNDLFTQDIEFEPHYETQKSGLEKILLNPAIGEILVLQMDNKIIGMVSLLYSISTALGGKVAILEDMIIHKDYRNKGFGKQLLQEAINFSVIRNCLRITLLTDFNNDIAINFYEGFGFKKSDMIPLRLITT